MKARFWSAFALLLAFALQGARAQSFPAGDVFTPLVADPLEPRNFLSVLSVDSETVQTTLGSVGVGANFGFYRWAGQQPGDGWQVGLFAAVNSQFDLEGTSYPLVNTDFRFGVPVSFRNGAWSGRARLYHQSSHLGDELILQGNAESISASRSSISCWHGSMPAGGLMPALATSFTPTPPVSRA
jgi:hypothetical protein